MSPTDDDGYAVSYKVLEPGTPVHSSDGEELGTVREVLENKAEHIFDGLVIDTPAGERFVDAPEVARIAERRVTLTLDAEGAASLPERDSAGGPDVHRRHAGGKLSRFLAGAGNASRGIIAPSERSEEQAMSTETRQGRTATWRPAGRTR